MQGDQKVSVHLKITIQIISCKETFWSPCIYKHMTHTNFCIYRTYFLMMSSKPTRYIYIYIYTVFKKFPCTWRLHYKSWSSQRLPDHSAYINAWHIPIAVYTESTSWWWAVNLLYIYIYRAIKKSLCIWRLQYKSLGSQRLYYHPVYINAWHIPIAVCAEKYILIMSGKPAIYTGWSKSICAKITVQIIRFTETLWSPCIYKRMTHTNCCMCRKVSPADEK
jgi:hypothetical protein